jgi:hypothetical protein
MPSSSRATQHSPRKPARESVSDKISRFSKEFMLKLGEMSFEAAGRVDQVPPGGLISAARALSRTASDTRKFVVSTNPWITGSKSTMPRRAAAVMIPITPTATRPSDSAASRPFFSSISTILAPSECAVWMAARSPGSRCSSPGTVSATSASTCSHSGGCAAHWRNFSGACGWQHSCSTVYGQITF